MTIIDGTRTAGTITLPGATLDRLDDLGRILGLSPSELVTLAIAHQVAALVTPAPQVAPLVECGSTPPSIPGDGRTGGEAPPSSPPVVVYAPLTYSCPDCGERSFHTVCG